MLRRSPALRAGLVAPLALALVAATVSAETGWLGEPTPEPDPTSETVARGVITLVRPARVDPPAPLPHRDETGEIGLDLLADVVVRGDAASPAVLAAARDALEAGRAEQAIAAWRLAYAMGHPRPEVDWGLAQACLVDERPASGILHAERALESDHLNHREIHLALGKLEALRGDVSREIAHYERVLQMDQDWGEAHFLLALAYDKVDNSPKVLEHAQKAIRIDPEYKAKLKPRIKDSNVSRKIGRLVSHVLRDQKYERLTDEQIEAYARDMAQMLGGGPKSLPPPAPRPASPFVTR